MRVVLCTNFVSPYRAPLFDCLARTHGWDLHVLASSGVEGDRGWDAIDAEAHAFEIDRCCGLRWSRTYRAETPIAFEQRIERHVPVDIAMRIRRLRPDMVISSELGPRSWLAWAGARVAGAPFVLWAYQSRAGACAWRRQPHLRRRLLACSDAVIGMGAQARECLVALGADADRIHDAPNAADDRGIEARLRTAEHVAAVERIRRLDPYGRRRLLIAGRLVPMKGADRFIDSWERIPVAIRTRWIPTFLGDGPLAPMVAEHPELEHVPFVSPEEVPDWMAASDLHVFPSLGDPWGLVVNEAMQCATPTACSVQAGCSDDLVRDGEDGFHIDMAQGAVPLAKQLRRILTHPDLHAVGQAARRRVRWFSTRGMADGIAGAAIAARRTWVHRTGRATA